MAQRTVVVASASGLHARPAKLFVQAAVKAGVPVTIRAGDKAVPAKSMLGVLSLGGGPGHGGHAGGRRAGGRGGARHAGGPAVPRPRLGRGPRCLTPHRPPQLPPTTPPPPRRRIDDLRIHRLRTRHLRTRHLRTRHLRTRHLRTRHLRTGRFRIGGR
ncbi:HPr family phosphocarrier protein [Nonomuraea salmonea]|uniref:HPr family phosphocarrier protein n=1 Tax=Nonomuraea salmonea TaxID=46181 RepID=UPI002FEB0ADA